VGVAATLTGYPENAKIGRFSVFTDKIGNVSAVVSMDAAVSAGTAAGTGLKFRFKTAHVSVKKRF
jgi:hypothetical protein